MGLIVPLRRGSFRRRIAIVLNSSPDEMADLARTMREAYRRLQAVRPEVPLDLTLHTAPNGAMRLREDEWRSLPEDYHWHIEAVPDSSARESVGGFAVNPVPPEIAAKRLREVV